MTIRYSLPLAILALAASLATLYGLIFGPHVVTFIGILSHFAFYGLARVNYLRHRDDPDAGESGLS